MDSILNSIKKTLGIEEDCEDFDEELIIHINSVFIIVNQIGIPKKVDTVMIDSKENKWEDFFDDNKIISLLKSYVYMKVRLLFDPPTNSSLLESMKSSINEYEWRLNVQSENGSFN